MTRAIIIMVLLLSLGGPALAWLHGGIQQMVPPVGPPDTTGWMDFSANVAMAAAVMP